MHEAFKEETFKREIDTAKRAIESNNKELVIEAGLVVVALAAKWLLALELPEGKKDMPPKDKNFMLLKEVREEKREEKKKEVEQKIVMNNLNQELNAGKIGQKEEKEKFVLKEHEITDKYAFISYNPLTQKAEVVKEDVKISFSSIEQKIVDEAFSLKDADKALAYIADPVIKKEPEEIQKETMEIIKNKEKEKAAFGKDIYSELIKSIDKYVSEKPENIDEAIKRKQDIMNEIEKIEKVLEEAKKAAESKDYKLLDKHISSLPPIMRKRLEISMKEKREKIKIFILLELLFARNLKNALNSIGIKSIINIAKTITMSIMASVIRA
ncbi:MAG: hypothetical protein QXS91_03555 [Candidatus Anstonellales archaeon]